MIKYLVACANREDSDQSVQTVQSLSFLHVQSKNLREPRKCKKKKKKDGQACVALQSDLTKLYARGLKAISDNANHAAGS